MNDWDEIEGFSKKEFAPPVNVPYEWDMHPTLIRRLCIIRGEGMNRYGKFRILIHENGGYSVDGHSKTSLHYGSGEAQVSGLDCRLGLAVDFHCEHWSSKHNCWVLVPWLDQVMMLYPDLSAYEWGIGLHPEWNCSGFHLDYRGGVRGPAVWWKHRIDGYKNYPFSEFSRALEDVLENEFLEHQQSEDSTQDAKLRSMMREHGKL